MHSLARRRRGPKMRQTHLKKQRIPRCLVVGPTAARNPRLCCPSARQLTRTPLWQVPAGPVGPASVLARRPRCLGLRRAGGAFAAPAKVQRQRVPHPGLRSRSGREWHTAANTEKMWQPQAGDGELRQRGPWVRSRLSPLTEKGQPRRCGPIQQGLSLGVETVQRRRLDNRRRPCGIGADLEAVP